MSKVAFISFNTGGTLGHMTLLSKLAKGFINEHEIHILSEGEYKKHSFLNGPRIQWGRFSEQKHLKSNGGEIKHNSITEIFDYCVNNNIDYAIYSTFFDSTLVKNLSKVGIKNFYISYPLRDTYSELFFLRQYNSIFNQVIILKDLYTNKYPKSVKRSNPILSPYQKQENNDKRILLTCGGGGRPSSIKFLQLMKAYVPAIKNIYDAEITLIKGPNNKEIEIEDIITLESTNNMQKYIDEAKIVVSEAGYFTTHELISRSKPSILIPGERRIDNQELRSIEYEKKGLGYCVMPEDDTTLLVSRSLDLLTNQKKYGQIQTNCEEYHSQYEQKDNIENILRGLLL
jgi:UDP-N-acetylglucosamine:LPS N-acetylglucosamine transferase